MISFAKASVFACVVLSWYHHSLVFCSEALERLTHTEALRSIPPLFRYAFLWPLSLPDDKQARDETAQPEHGDGGNETRQSCASGDNNTIDCTKAPKGKNDYTCSLPWPLFAVAG